jgi:hypothetical protein
MTYYDIKVGLANVLSRVLLEKRKAKESVVGNHITGR